VCVRSIDFVISSKLHSFLHSHPRNTLVHYAKPTFATIIFESAPAVTCNRSIERVSECDALQIQSSNRCWFRANFSRSRWFRKNWRLRLDLNLIEMVCWTRLKQRPRMILSFRISLNDDSRAWNSIKSTTILHSYSRRIKSQHVRNISLNFETSIQFLSSSCIKYCPREIEKGIQNLSIFLFLFPFLSQATINILSNKCLAKMHVLEADTRR